MQGVFIYNGFSEPIQASYAGIPWSFPPGLLTAIPDQTLREVDVELTYGANGERTGDDGVIYKHIHVPAAIVARELISKNNFEERGVRVLAENRITDAEKQACAEAAKDYKLRQIAEYQIERTSRQAGGQGRLYPEPHITRWIKELGIVDELINPAQKMAAAAPSTDPKLAEALNRLAQALEPAGAKNQ